MQTDLKDELAKQGVKLIGGGLDEAPLAYKNIHNVMNAQKNLVETIVFLSKNYENVCSG